MKSYILAIVFIVSISLGNSQNLKHTFFATGNVAFDKNDLYHLEPRLGYFFTDKDAFGVSYRYKSGREQVINSLVMDRKVGTMNLFYRRRSEYFGNLCFFVEPSIGLGKGKTFNNKGERAYKINNAEASLNLGIMLFLTGNISAEFIPFNLRYQNSHYKGITDINVQNINGTFALGNRVGINLYLRKGDTRALEKPQNLTDRKVITGSLIFSNEKNSNFEKTTRFVISPGIGIFMTNWIQIGFNLSLISDSKNFYNILSQYNEKYSSLAFQLGPRVKVYKWLTSASGVFIETYLEGAFVFNEFDNANFKYESKRIESLGGVNIGFSNFISDRIILEGTTNIYSVDNNRFTPLLTRMTLSMGFLLGRN